MTAATQQLRAIVFAACAAASVAVLTAQVGALDHLAVRVLFVYAAYVVTFLLLRPQPDPLLPPTAAPVADAVAPGPDRARTPAALVAPAPAVDPFDAFLAALHDPGEAAPEQPSSDANRASDRS